jgi:uncharacterized protein YjbI with pentapeptide repeats
MRIIKPVSLSVVNRPISYSGGRVKLLVTVMAGFTQQDDKQTLVSEPTIWKALSSVLPPQIAPDLGFEKPFCEWLAFGKIHPKTLGDRTAVASVKVLRRGRPVSQKVLHLSGVRTWQRRLGTYWAPEPAELHGPVPLDWRLAYGGAKHDTNPQGMGQQEGEAAGVRLPQIEYFDNLMSRPHDNPPPAGFGPLPLDAPARFKPHGTYDKNWLQTDFPAMPADTPPEVLMMGPEDQWLKEGLFAGDSITCSGMTDEGLEIKWTVPTWSPRCYIRRTDQGKQLMDVKLKMDTAWLIPHAGILSVLWRGVADITETDAHDVDLLFAALEDTDQPKSHEHYEEQVLRRSITQKQAALAMLDDGPLLPEGQIGSLISELSPQSKARIIKMQEQASALKLELEAQKKNIPSADQSIADSTATATQSDLGAAFVNVLLSATPDAAKFAELINQATEQAKQARKQSIENLKAVFAKHGVDPETAIASSANKGAGPPSRTLQAHLNQLEKAFAQGNLEPTRFLAEKESLLNALHAQNTVYRKTVHHLPGASALMDPDTLGQEIVEHLHSPVAGTTALAGVDWIGANLIGVNLDGKDLSGVFLDGANLEGASLVGANLSNATLSGANLKNANISYANLKNANLGKADLSEAKFKQAMLTHAILDKANLSKATFSEANMQSCSFIGAIIQGAIFDEAILDESRFLGLRIESKTTFASLLNENETQTSPYEPIDFSNTSWKKTSLKKVIVLAAEGEHADFSGADLTKASLVECRFLSTNFSNAVLESTNVVSESSLQKSDFTNAKIESSFLRGVDLSDSCFLNATVRKSNFSLCNLTNANAVGLQAGLARFDRATLLNCNFSKANLNSASLTAAQIGLSNFSEADLTLADFTKASGNAATNFKKSILNFTKIDQALKD